MTLKISGLIIDHTRQTGNWYVREIKDQNGGVKPLFFRREKSDLIGRLIDKFRGVESGGRYAARQQVELNFTPTQYIKQMPDQTGQGEASAASHAKIPEDELTALLHQKIEEAPADNTPMKTYRGQNRLNKQSGIKRSLPVTVVRGKNEFKKERDHMWEVCKRCCSPDIRGESYKVLSLALRLSRGDLSTSNPALWTECRSTVNYLNAHVEQFSVNEDARKALGELAEYFALPPIDVAAKPATG